MSGQLPLFEFAPDSPRDSTSAALDQVHAEALSIADRLSSDIRFGTSSWSFPGWKGLVYSGTLSGTALAREGLREYAKHPLLRTVGIDRTYYAPITIDELRRYADQLPEGFRGCAKAPASVTALTTGAPGSTVRINDDFMSAERLIEDLLLPFSVGFRDHTGPFILEFPPFPRQTRLEPSEFVERLDRFLSQLPRDHQFAVELREARLLTAAYAEVLTRHQVGHVYNYWSAMPMPAQQAAVMDPARQPFVVVRLLLRPGTWYADQRERFQPFNAIVQPDEVMREQVATLSDRALTAGRKVWVLVNNKAEGSSPLTIMELARRVAQRGHTGRSPTRAP
jgi:uncharacterized protein YecE (DUF72 family)